MTKKKTRPKHQKDFADTSEEDQICEANFTGKFCPHIVRGVNFGRVKKILKGQDLFTCSACTDSVPEEDEGLEIWLCLQCGYRGCGRMSTNKHGLQHFKTIHSDCHSLVLGSSSGSVWCYDCDDEIPLQSSRLLKQSVEFILKLKTNNNVKSNALKTIDEKKPLPIQQSLCETLKKDTPNVKGQQSEASPKKTNPKIESKGKKDIPPPKVHVKGLRNLGNTCYFNAVMQNLSQTHLLFHALELSSDSAFTWEIPKLVVQDDSVVEEKNETIKVTLPPGFQMVHTFLQFLKNMSSPSQQKGTDVINPSDVFKELQKKSPHFQNHLQQDSHELLRQFLDGIRQDEVKRLKKAILRHFNIVNISPENIEEDVKKLIKAYSCYASHTIIEKVFGGLLISTVLCEECKMSSQVFEPFMDMSLPMFEEKGHKNQNHDHDSDETKEYALTKPSKDYSKPSKHQEKKMKQMEKREKKKNKRMLQKKVSFQLLGKESTPEGDALPQTADGQNNGEDSDQDNDSDCRDAGSMEPDNTTEDKEPKVETGNNETNCEESSNKKEVEEEEKCNGFNDVDSSTGENRTANMSGETLDSAGGFEMQKVEMEQEDNNSSKLNNSSHMNGGNEDGNLSSIKNLSINGECTDESPLNLSETCDTSNNSSHLNAEELYERMHALSMHVKEIRIRKDSDRQESLLSSSSSTDDVRNSKTNTDSDDSDENCDSVDRDDLSHTLSESQTKEWIMKSLTTLKPRTVTAPLECSIHSCLSHFTKPELLTGNNKFRCENCTKIKCQKSGDKKAVAYSNASKQLLIFSPPAILTLHLKRFQQLGMSLRKVNRFVEFPLLLDLAPYCSSACLILPHMASTENEILYSLYGVVEHSGQLKSGHYTAYVKASERTVNSSFMNHLPLAQCNLEQLLHKFSKATSLQTDSDTTKTISPDNGQWYYISDSQVRDVSVSQVLKCQAYLLFYERIK